VVNIGNASFPLTLESFVALQRENLGRELTKDELGFFAEIVNMANETHEAATRGDAETVGKILAALNSVPVTDAYTQHLAALCRGWVLLGCSRGTERLKAAIDGLS
jgi:hypothetical protein